MTRVSTLYPKGYGWKGECPACGGNDWEFQTWEKGYRVTCVLCTYAICTHTLHGGEHDSLGQWTGPKTAPKGCPWANLPPREPLHRFESSEASAKAESRPTPHRAVQGQLRTDSGAFQGVLAL